MARLLRCVNVEDMSVPAQREQTPDWCWRVGRLLGVDLYVHATFAVLLVWIAVAALMRGQGARAVAGDVLFVGAVFIAVILHELGHVLVARRFGITTHGITLLPIGGMAAL